MVVLKTSSDNSLEKVITEHKNELLDSELIFFVTADDIKYACGVFNDLLPDSNVMGFHTYVLNGGICHKSGTFIVAIENNSVFFNIAFGLIENADMDPVKCVLNLQKQITSVNPGKDDTICLEFCTSGEERLVTTLNSIIKQHGITVFGSTTDCIETPYPSYLYYNGILYDNACAYVLIKNKCGRIITQSQNIYKHHEGGEVYIATKVDKDTRTLIELNGRPATEVYCQELGITLDGILDALPYHPFAKSIGEKDYLVSIKDFNSDGSISLFKQINQNDQLFISDLGDYENIIKNHLESIKRDYPNAATMVTIDCVYRYQLFTIEGKLDWYAESLGNLGIRTIGILGDGEQYDVQHCNQSMICAIFENNLINKTENKKYEDKTDDTGVTKESIKELSSKIKREENRQKKENLNARIYPLEFMMKYVTCTKDSIVQRETFVLENLLNLRQHVGKILESNDRDVIEKYAGYIINNSDLMAERLADINMQIEDMSNMLEQTEYLLNDVVYVDGLTGLLNRSFYNIMSDDLFEEAMKSSGMSMAFFDIDNFKHFNTDYGHDFGDEVLKQLAEQLKYHFREKGISHLIRMGGDEFMVLNPAIMPYKDFIGCMEKFRARIAKFVVSHKGCKASMTISIGMADAGKENIDSMWNLYRCSDGKLYKAKDNGKNRIIY